MPIYEYQCQSCSHHVEVLQKISEAALTVCEKCNQPDLRKLVSRSGFELKGTGWYATDFRNKSSDSSEPSSSAKTEQSTPASSATESSNSKTGTT